MSVRLSPEQVRILQLVAEGWTDKRIARELGVSESTVQRRLRRLCEEIGADSRVGLALRAASLGLVEFPRTEDP